MRPSDLALIAQTRAELSSGRAREMRDAADLTQSEAAAALGVSRQALSKWERGSSTPDTAHALAYGRLLRDLAKLAA